MSKRRKVIEKCLSSILKKKKENIKNKRTLKQASHGFYFLVVFCQVKIFFSLGFFQCEQAGSLPGLYSAVVFWTKSIWSSAYACCVYPNRSDFCQIFPASSSLFILYFVFSVFVQQTIPCRPRKRPIMSIEPQQKPFFLNKYLKNSLLIIIVNLLVFLHSPN